MKNHKVFLLLGTIMLLLMGCITNENNISETNKSENIESEKLVETKDAFDELKAKYTIINEELTKLEEENSKLKVDLDKTNERNQELNDKLLDITNTQEKNGHNEISEEKARELVFNHKKEFEGDYVRGYQYCIYKKEDVYTVEVFSPEPGTDDRSAMLLDQYELDTTSLKIIKVEEESPGQKQKCIAGYEI